MLDGTLEGAPLIQRGARESETLTIRLQSHHQVIQSLRPLVLVTDYQLLTMQLPHGRHLTHQTHHIRLQVLTITIITILLYHTERPIHLRHPRAQPMHPMHTHIQASTIQANQMHGKLILHTQVLVSSCHLRHQVHLWLNQAMHHLSLLHPTSTRLCTHWTTQQLLWPLPVFHP